MAWGWGTGHLAQRGLKHPQELTGGAQKLQCLFQEMVGGGNHEAKELLNLTACMDYCQVSTSAERQQFTKH